MSGACAAAVVLLAWVAVVQGALVVLRAVRRRRGPQRVRVHLGQRRRGRRGGAR